MQGLQGYPSVLNSDQSRPWSYLYLSRDQDTGGSFRATRPGVVWPTFTHQALEMLTNSASHRPSIALGIKASSWANLHVDGDQRPKLGGRWGRRKRPRSPRNQFLSLVLPLTSLLPSLKG